MMKQEDLLQQLQNVKKVVKNSLRQKGIVVPVKTKRGLKLDDYEIVEDENGYHILDKWRVKCYSNIHYIQTAVLVANTMALKRTVKDEWLRHDAVAGSTDFDMKVFNRRFQSSVKNKDMFGILHYQTRLFETKLKHKSHIKEINSAYDRLLSGVKSLEKSNKYS